MNETKSIIDELDKIQRLGYTVSNVFRDFVKLSLFTLYRDDDKYLDVMNRYKNEREKGKREADYFANAFAELLRLTGKYNKELLGGLYMEVAGNYSAKSFGQFFTPHPLCDMMAKITIQENNIDSPTVADSACGSGRNLIAAAKYLPTTAHFTGVDFDNICAHMTAINMVFFNMNGVVIHGNTITMEYFNGWITKRTVSGGIIREMTEDELNNYKDLRGKALKEETEDNKSKQLAMF